MGRIAVALPALLILLASCSSEPDASEATSGVNAMLDKQVEAWNNGRLDDYLSAYAKSDSTRFAAGRVVTIGFESIRQRMKASYPDASSMGTLRVIDVDTDGLTEDKAVVFGKWMLYREADRPWGLFTLLVVKTEEGWKILHDHTSSSEN